MPVTHAASHERGLWPPTPPQPGLGASSRVGARPCGVSRCTGGPCSPGPPSQAVQLPCSPPAMLLQAAGAKGARLRASSCCPVRFGGIPAFPCSCWGHCRDIRAWRCPASSPAPAAASVLAGEGGREPGLPGAARSCLPCIRTRSSAARSDLRVCGTGGKFGEIGTPGAGVH